MISVVVQPKSFPLQLLNKDWSKRRCETFRGSQEFADKVHDMEVLNDDVWLVTLPKCGTTWMQELLWLVMHDYDFETAKNVQLELRTPFLEFDYLLNENLECALKPVEDLKSPRLIKSHLPLALLPTQLWNKKPKVIYVYRNPKDYIVSISYQERNIGVMRHETLDQFADEFITLQSTIPSKDFEHVAEFYALRHEPWILYTSFEYMKKELRGVINQVCTFLNKSITEQQIQQLLHHLSFKEMQKSSALNHEWEFEQVRRKLGLKYEQHNFIRRGKVGGYKDELSAEAIAKVDAWIEKQLLYQGLTMDELLLLETKQSNGKTEKHSTATINS